MVRVDENIHFIEFLDVLFQLRKLLLAFLLP